MKNWFGRSGLNKAEKEIVSNVDKHGCHLTGVFDPDDGDPPFVYSIGFTKTIEKVSDQTKPEAIIFGLPGDLCGPALNGLLATSAAGHTELLDGERIEGFFGDYDGIVRQVHPSWIIPDYFGSAIWYHETQMGRAFDSAVMIVWPDKDGIFPWEDGCEDWVRADQPALYEARLNS